MLTIGFILGINKYLIFITLPGISLKPFRICSYRNSSDFSFERTLLKARGGVLLETWSGDYWVLSAEYNGES